ncbi:MAG: acid phosphatase [Lentinula lateritia]|uniref:Phytase A n=1 Tax=Lentinula lateritia TaxID=40482 RepID=A0ABQ8VLM5_9AGAR|nr:MAG: acid phosphatase [Lentinula lateritia]KAJ4497298.1 histidine phosphatase superfamily [Lentinula lateritia]
MLPPMLRVFLLPVVYALLAVSRASADNQFGLQERLTPPYVLQQNWGAYSPYYPVAKYVAPPEGCSITQINILQRHGARYPTASPGAAIAIAVNKLQNASVYTDSSLNFIRNFTFDLGTNNLVLFGAAQSLAAGAETYNRYKELVSVDNLPFVRASSSDRVVKSALNWTYGFSAASSLRFNPVLSVILDENANDTLHNSCGAIGSSDNQTDTWIAIYTPSIVQRLNNAAPGANLSSNDVFNLMTLCAFESVATESISDWCGLFDEDEWRAFEYEMDLDKYYGTGYGQPLGPVEGIGYINELIARLTSSPVNDTTQTNSTLDRSPVTFPLDRTIYADFSHDNQLIAIYTAMGLFKQARALDPTNSNFDSTNGSWITSQLVPFSARMVIEKIQCGIGSSRQDEDGDYIRILVNDAVQSLDFCAGVSKEGICRVSEFVESQSYATNGGNGDWQKCFE